MHSQVFVNLTFSFQRCNFYHVTFSASKERQADLISAHILHIEAHTNDAEAHWHHEGTHLWL